MGVLMVGVFGIAPDSASGGNPMEQALWSGIYLVTFFFLLLHYKRVLYVVTSNKIMWLLIGLLVTYPALYPLVSGPGHYLTQQRSVGRNNPVRRLSGHTLQLERAAANVSLGSEHNGGAQLAVYRSRTFWWSRHR